MIDRVTIVIKAGNGGDGLASFKREKYVPKGGPDGGDGGKGGNVIFRVEKSLNTLIKYNTNRVYAAQNGQNGMSDARKGKDGVDLILDVPIGTVVYSKNNKLADLNNHNSEFVVSTGGKGGVGNIHFKSSTNQTPRQFIKGEVKYETEITLELKLLADIGLIGLPNSGKSSLLNLITNASAKTANYEFTTLEPNLGLLYLKNFIKKSPINSLVVADIPGLIEGASLGKGLGHDFLRHIERTKILVHILDGSVLEGNTIELIIKNYEIVRKELNKWNPVLTQKPEIIAINKTDLSIVESNLESIKEAFRDRLGLSVVFISNYSSRGITELLDAIIKGYLDTLSLIESNDTIKVKTIYTINDLKNRRIIYRKLSIREKI